MIVVAAAMLAALSLLPAPSGAASDPLQDTLGTVSGVLGQATAAVPPVSAGGGALPQVTAGPQQGGGLQLTVTPGGTATVPGTDAAPSQPSQPQQQTQSPQGSSPAPPRGDSGASGGQGPGAASPASGGRRSGTAGEGGRASSGSGFGATAGGSGPTGAEGPAGRGDSGGGAGQRDKPSFVTQVVEEIPPMYRAALLGFGAIAIMLGLLSLYEGRRSRRAQEDALSDQLTGLANRQAFEQELDREWKRAGRYEHDLGLLLIDLDGFKEINDTHGHIAGDRVLREAAASIAGRMRETDFPARLGGDEFVVICPETGAEGMRTVAEGLEHTLREDGIAASVGFADRLSSDQGPADLIARADAEMYHRKRESGGGRERTPAPIAA